jgi:hypothetical protein
MHRLEANFVIASLKNLARSKVQKNLKISVVYFFFTSMKKIKCELVIVVIFSLVRFNAPQGRRNQKGRLGHLPPAPHCALNRFPGNQDVTVK